MFIFRRLEFITQVPISPSESLYVSTKFWFNKSKLCKIALRFFNRGSYALLLFKAKQLLPWGDTLKSPCCHFMTFSLTVKVTNGKISRCCSFLGLVFQPTLYKYFNKSIKKDNYILYSLYTLHPLYILYSLTECDLGQKGYPKFSTRNKAGACLSRMNIGLRSRAWFCPPPASPFQSSILVCLGITIGH